MQSTSLKIPKSILLTLLVLGLGACNKPAPPAGPAAGPGGPPPGPPPISAALVIEKAVVDVQEFSGRLEAVERVDIRPRVAGFISTVHFQPGAEVKKGTLLFTVDPRPWQAELNRTQALAQAAQVRSQLARLELVRANKLLSEKAVPQREVDEKSAHVDELAAAAAAAAAQYETARLNLDFTRIRAPIDGRLSRAEITAGNLVDSNVILTSMVSTRQIHASFEADENSFLRVSNMTRKNAPVSVRIGLSNESGFPHEGVLEFVDNRVDPASGSVRMRATIPNPERNLAPGLFARVQLSSADGKNGESRSAMIADTAVGTDQNRKFVYVVSAQGLVQYRPVQLGPLVDGLRVVRQGLQPGEKIIVNGLQRVRPGIPVAAKMVAMESPSQPGPLAKPETKVTMTTAPAQAVSQLPATKAPGA